MQTVGCDQISPSDRSFRRLAASVRSCFKRPRSAFAVAP